ncbi:MAG: DUF373 family protein [Candidatus Diapherotrites archaeon]|nr:DUF373 family protein [Candidatus Diapherotrites archaeon]
MSKKPSTIILCVDRDNDLGRKARVEGPVIGRDKNIEAAQKLLLADPTESDANCIFAAVKMYDEIKKDFENLEVVTITGHGKSGIKSDQKLNEQLDELEKQYSFEGIILVTDGAEDDQVIPILNSRSKIISKEVVIVKQAKQVESAYYTIKEALSDPYIARIVFGIPGLIFLFYAITLALEIEGLFIRGVFFIVGIYLVMKGLGIEVKIAKWNRELIRSLSPQRTSFLFYLGSLVIAILGIYTIAQAAISDPIAFFDSGKYLKAVQGSYLFFAIAAICVGLGRIADHLHLKKAYMLRMDTLYIASVLVVWIIADAATLVIAGNEDLNFMLLSIMACFVLLLIAFKLADVLDITRKATKIMIGLPAYDTSGKWLGKIVEVDPKRNTIKFEKNENEKKSSEKFKLSRGKVLVFSS